MIGSNFRVECGTRNLVLTARQSHVCKAGNDFLKVSIQAQFILANLVFSSSPCIDLFSPWAA